MSPTGFPNALIGARACSPPCDVPGVAGQEHHDRLAVGVLVEPRGRRGDPHRGHQGQLRRRLRRRLAEHLEDPGGLLGAPRHGAREDLGPERVEDVLDTRQHAEVPASPTEAPEEVGVLLLARVHEPPVGGHDVHGPDVVARPPESARGVPEAAAQGEPGDARGGDEAEDGRQPVELRLPVHVAEEAARLRPGGPGPRVDPHPPHQGEVEHQAALGHRQARDVVAAALHGQGDSALPGEAHAGDDVGRRRCTARRGRVGDRSSRSRRNAPRRIPRRRQGGAVRAGGPQPVHLLLLERQGGALPRQCGNRRHRSPPGAARQARSRGFAGTLTLVEVTPRCHRQQGLIELFGEKDRPRCPPCQRLRRRGTVPKRIR